MLMTTVGLPPHRKGACHVGFGKGKRLSASLSAKRSFDRKHTTPVLPTGSGPSISLQEKAQPALN